MKACPGLRSRIDRSGSLSFAIRGIPSPIRPPIRHSGEGRNPEGRERGHFLSPWERIEVRANLTAPEFVPTEGSPAYHNFHPLMRPSQGHGHSGGSRNPGEAGPYQRHPNTSSEQSSILIPSCAGATSSR